MLTIVVPRNQSINWKTCALASSYILFFGANIHKTRKALSEEEYRRLFESDVVIAVENSSKEVNEFCQRHLFALVVMQLMAPSGLVFGSETVCTRKLISQYSLMLI